MPRFPLALAVLIALAAPGAAQTPEQRIEWNRPMPPFRIAENLYYVGTAGIAVYLITDPKGHILLDGGLPESAPLIADNIRSLGFRIEDVAYLLNSHAHADHAGGLAELKRLSGAAFVASAGDRRELEAGEVHFREAVAFPPVKVDRVIADGESVQVGEAEMTAFLTPGHTPGCTSWRTRIVERGRPLEVLFSCSLTVAGQPLVGDDGYPGAVQDFKASFARLKALRVDMFLANHGVFFDLDAKRERVAAGEPDAYVQPDELAAYVARSEAAFDEELARQKDGGTP